MTSTTLKSSLPTAVGFHHPLFEMQEVDFISTVLLAANTSSFLLQL